MTAASNSRHLRGSCVRDFLPLAALSSTTCTERAERKGENSATLDHTTANPSAALGSFSGLSARASLRTPGSFNFSPNFETAVPRRPIATIDNSQPPYQCLSGRASPSLPSPSSFPTPPLLPILTPTDPTATSTPARASSSAQPSCPGPQLASTRPTTSSAPSGSCPPRRTRIG